MNVTLRPATHSDTAAWLELRSALWPDCSASEHRAEIERFFAGEMPEPQAVYLAIGPGEEVVGFVELSLRPYAEGCHTHNVAYLEGWYVAPHVRGKGVGANLIAKAEAWGRGLGCSEFASDAAFDNETSCLAHRALGFDEVGLIRCFRKPL